MLRPRIFRSDRLSRHQFLFQHNHKKVLENRQQFPKSKEETKEASSEPQDQACPQYFFCPPQRRHLYIRDRQYHLQRQESINTVLGNFWYQHGHIFHLLRGSENC